MDIYRNSGFVRTSVVVFSVLPLLLYTLSGFPKRSLLKESLSVVTILGLFLMVAMIFWSRANTIAVKELKMRRTIKIHKAIGYTCVAIMLLHPLFLVFPRFIEAGIAPGFALVTIVTTIRTGTVLGMLAWILLLIIGITALMRNRLPMTYRTWRRWHGLLAVALIIAAAWHAIDLGRHSSLAMSSLIVLLTTFGVGLFMKHILSSKS